MRLSRVGMAAGDGNKGVYHRATHDGDVLSAKVPFLHMESEQEEKREAANASTRHEKSAMTEAMKKINAKPLEHSNKMMEEGRVEWASGCHDLHTPHPARWNTLFLWWGTHALVGGAVRVIFEAEMIAITRSPRFDIAEADIVHLLQAGTMSCVVGKLLCGPIVALIGVLNVGLVSLVLCGITVLGVGISNPSGAPLVSVFMAWNLIRVFQTATWPATSLLLASWFPKREQGKAWGIMSTSSRTGIILVTIAISLRDAWRAPPHANAGAYLEDKGDAVQSTFLVVGLVMLLWAGLIARVLRNKPESTPVLDSRGQGSPSKPSEGWEADETTAVGWATCTRLLLASVSRPMFICAFVAQGMATPVAEFQSQVPLLSSFRPRTQYTSSLRPQLKAAYTSSLRRHR